MLAVAREEKQPSDAKEIINENRREAGIKKHFEEHIVKYLSKFA